MRIMIVVVGYFLLILMESLGIILREEKYWEFVTGLTGLGAILHFLAIMALDTKSDSFYRTVIGYWDDEPHVMVDITGYTIMAGLAGISMHFIAMFCVLTIATIDLIYRNRAEKLRPMEKDFREEWALRLKEEVGIDKPEDPK